MYWIEAIIETLSSEDGLPAEIITAELMELGVTGIQTEDAYELGRFLANNETHWDYSDPELIPEKPGKTFIKFYLTEEDSEDTLSKIRAALDTLKQGEFAGILGCLTMSAKRVDDENWLNEWKKYYKPFRIGEKVVIRPLWEEYERNEGEIVVSLNPGAVFGTGLHQSTRMCVKSLEKYSRNGQKTLDMGCGSGILSITALLLAENSRAVAVDIDKTAITSAYENAGHNGITMDRFRALAGNILSDTQLFDDLSRERYDIILVNIIADVIIAMAPALKGLLAPGGKLIASGIIREKAGRVMEALEDNGYEIIEIMTEDDWVCVTAEFKV